MNVWENGVITNKGLALQSKLFEGTSLTITRAAVGSGYVSPDLLAEATALTDERNALTLQPATYPEKCKCKLVCTLENDEITTGYIAMQVGVYALDPDEGEILYFIVQAAYGTGTIIPSHDEMPGYTSEWSCNFKFGQADAVIVEVDPSNAVTIEVVEGLLKGKADTDLGNVTDVVFREKAVASGAAVPIVTTAGDSENYTATVPGMNQLEVGMTFIVIPHVTSSTTMPTLNVNGTGALPLRQQLSINNAATVPGALPTWLSKGFPCMVTYDGTLWRVNITRPSATGLYGVVPIENGGTAGRTPKEARENLGVPSMADFEALLRRIEQLEMGITHDITSNSHTIDFDDLDGLNVTGVWNEEKARLEC